jgi:hypothetical protein
MLNFDRLFIYEETVLDNLYNAVSSFSIILKLKGKNQSMPPSVASSRNSWFCSIRR